MITKISLPLLLTCIIGCTGVEYQFYTFENTKPANNEGGHIQGIQWQSVDDDQFYWLSGSSSSYAYLAIASISGTRGTVDTVLRLAELPLKHAGGFQISEHYLAVGIEDNEERNYSEVRIYDVSDPESTSTTPLETIIRTGEYQRKTAGCVAMIRRQDHWLLMVGDWDTKHLDVYLSHSLKIADGFSLRQEISTDSIIPGDGVTWLPYQNINLFETENGLHLAGMARDGDQNILDIYNIGTINDTLELEPSDRITIPSKGGNFRWAGGLKIEEGKRMSVLLNDENIHRGTNKIYEYVLPSL